VGAPDRLGRPKDALGPIIDVHTHAFPDKVAESAIPKLEAGALWFKATASYDGTISGLLRSMDQAGIRKAIVCSIATRPEQVPKITDWCASIVSERIVPFASIHPDYPQPEAEVERMARAGVKGLKFHPCYMRCPLDDRRAIRIARAAAAAGLAMIFHAGYDLAFEKDDEASPARVRRLHEAVPDLRLVAAHLGGWERWPESLREVVGLPIFLETSFTIGRCPPDVLLELFERHPAERLLFGTDAPWTVQKDEVAKFLALPIGDDLKRRILWDNAHRFLGMEPGP
jgi:hypothetical protein